MISHRQNPENHNSHDNYDNKSLDSHMNNADVQRWKLFIYIKSRKPNQILLEIYTTGHGIHHSVHKTLLMKISNHHSNLNL
jgi:hypothetical protein